MLFKVFQTVYEKYIGKYVCNKIDHFGYQFWTVYFFSCNSNRIGYILYLYSYL